MMQLAESVEGYIGYMDVAFLEKFINSPSLSTNNSVNSANKKKTKVQKKSEIGAFNGENTNQNNGQMKLNTKEDKCGYNSNPNATPNLSNSNVKAKKNNQKNKQDTNNTKRATV